MGSNKALVGMSFRNKSGNLCKVLYIDGTYETGHLKYIVECEVCSKDKELWPEGSIHSKKHLISKGKSGCGCYKGTRWTESQYKLIIERKCGDLGFKFKGFVAPDSNITLGSYLRLYNPDTGNFWETCTLASFLANTGADPSLKMYNTNKTSSIKFLKTCDIPEDKVVKFVGGKAENTYTWEFQCKICSQDVVTNVLGLEYARFKTSPSGIRKCMYQCRCAARYIWSSEEREVILKDILSKENHTWSGWVNGIYKNQYSKFGWVCSEGHLCETTVKSFIKNGTRCRTCHLINTPYLHGHYPKREGESDYLYILHFGDFIKIGRSFASCIKKRLVNQIPKESKGKPFKVVCLKEGTHKEIFKLEQDLHELFAVESYTANCYKSIELFLSRCLPCVMKELHENHDNIIYDENGICLEKVIKIS